MPKIVGGSARGRIIKLPPGDVRPATARIRQSLFDYLQTIIEGACVLDLYCGSGGLGLEALSRGAYKCSFVDISQESIAVAQENAATLALDQKSAFIRQDVFKFLEGNRPSNDKFDLIFAAPPYRIAEPEKILQNLEQFPNLALQGSVCLEYSRHTNQPINQFFKLDRRKEYGETVIEVWDWEISKKIKVES